MKASIILAIVIAAAIYLYSLKGDAATANYNYHVTCIAPTERTDGTELTNLDGYRVQYLVCPDGAATSVNFPAAACDFTITLPMNNYCWTVFAFDANGVESAASNVEVLHTTDDSDDDGIPDYADNCTMLHNPTQVDSDGDGYGNRCDGDFNGNGVTNAQDVAMFRQQLGQPSVGPVYSPYDINANGTINSQDYVLMRQLLGSPAGPAGPMP